MKISKINIFTYHLPTTYPLKIKGQLLSLRNGIIVRINTGDNKTAFGEVAPLPGLHSENFEQALQQLKVVKSILMEESIPDVFEISGWLDTILPGNSWLPSVRFGVEAAFFNLGLHYKGWIKENPLALRKHNDVKINILADGDYQQILKFARDGIKKGYKSIKVKVGRLQIEDEIQLIKSVYEIVKKKASLRLDANQSWDLDEAEFFFRSTKNCHIEYIEEPLKVFSELPILFARTGMQIAIDENIRYVSPENLEKNSWIDSIVLKPAILGSVFDSISYIKSAGDLNMPCIISDSFHSGVGLSFLVNISATTNVMVPMGFDTYRYLKEDILKNRFMVSRGCYKVDDMVISFNNIDYSKLQEVKDSHSYDE